MKLNDEQITDLMLFTKQHLVAYYDVQLELVDHLANDIEYIWEENPSLSYEEAKQKAFKKFGVFGFLDVVEEKQKALRKRYWKMFGKIFISYFKIPKILMTLSLMMAYYLLISNVFFDKVLFITSYIIILFIALIKALKYHSYLKKKQKQTNKLWLFEAISNILPALLIMIQFPIQFLQFFGDRQFNIILTMFLSSVFIILFAISAYIITAIIPKEVQKIMQKEYINYKI